MINVNRMNMTNYMAMSIYEYDQITMSQCQSYEYDQITMINVNRTQKFTWRKISVAFTLKMSLATHNTLKFSSIVNPVMGGGGGGLRGELDGGR